MWTIVHEFRLRWLNWINLQVQYAVKVQRRGGVRAGVLRAQAAAAVLLALLAHLLPASSGAAAPRALLAAAPPTLLALALFYLGERLPSTQYSPDIGNNIAPILSQEPKYRKLIP